MRFAASVRVLMPRTGLLSVVSSVTVIATACAGGNPLAPGDTSMPSSVLLISCGEVLDGYQCRSTYATSFDDPGRDVTGLSTWTSSDTSVATIDSTGFATVTRAGNVAFRASYRGVEGFTSLHVEVGGLRRYYRAVSGWVTDSQDGTKLTNVDVRILDGPNAGRTASTGTSGAYQFYDLEIGTFTIRFSRDGYVTLERSYTLTGDTFNDFSVTMVKSSS